MQSDRWFARGLVAILVALACAGAPRARAGGTYLPAPVRTIYPGDVFVGSAITETPWDGEADGYVRTPGELIGRTARRTLLAGRPIPVGSVEDEHVICNGAVVQLQYVAPGLTITATGQALQSAKVGDEIRVRNVDSGLAVAGVATARGVVRVDR